MARIFLHINVSLDGYICDRAGNIDWHFADAEFQNYLDDLLQSIDAMVFGRVSYEKPATYWPHAGDEVSPVQRSKMHELPKYVLSHTLTETPTGWRGKPDDRTSEVIFGRSCRGSRKPRPAVDPALPLDVGEMDLGESMRQRPLSKRRLRRSIRSWLRH